MLLITRCLLWVPGDRFQIAEFRSVGKYSFPEYEYAQLNASYRSQVFFLPVTCDLRPGTLWTLETLRTCDGIFGAVQGNIVRNEGQFATITACLFMLELLNGKSEI
jgi:hypothetical protein